VYRLPRSAGGADLDGANLRHGSDAAHGDDARGGGTSGDLSVACAGVYLTHLELRRLQDGHPLSRSRPPQCRPGRSRPPRVVRVALDDAISALSRRFPATLTVALAARRGCLHGYFIGGSRPSSYLLRRGPELWIESGRARGWLTIPKCSPIHYSRRRPRRVDGDCNPARTTHRARSPGRLMSCSARS
jgi:hypothetical protein